MSNLINDLEIVLNFTFFLILHFIFSLFEVFNTLQKLKTSLKQYKFTLILRLFFRVHA